MDDQIINALNALCEKLGVAVDWTQQEILPYAKELFEKYIRYEIATSAAYCVIAISLSASLFFVARMMRKKAMLVGYSDDDFMEISSVALWFVFAIICIVAVFVTCSEIVDIITCLTFPEKMIIDYLGSLGG